MITPEAILYKTLNIFLELLRQDSIKTNEKTRFLYKLYKSESSPTTIENSDFYKNCVDLFKRDVKEPNKIQICLGYNQERSAQPTIHILLPQDRVKHHTIGEGEGFNENIYSEGEETEMLNNVFGANYSLLISSNSMNEVLCIYHTMKAMFLSLFEQFEHHGMMNLNFSGADVTLQSGNISPNIFHRNFSVSFDYEMNVPRFNSNEIKRFSKLFVKGFSVEEFNEENQTIPYPSTVESVRINLNNELLFTTEGERIVNFYLTNQEGSEEVNEFVFDFDTKKILLKDTELTLNNNPFISVTSGQEVNIGLLNNHDEFITPDSIDESNIYIKDSTIGLINTSAEELLVTSVKPQENKVLIAPDASLTLNNETFTEATSGKETNIELVNQDNVEITPLSLVGNTIKVERYLFTSIDTGTITPNSIYGILNGETT
jgi:hypothetical protein